MAAIKMALAVDLWSHIEDESLPTTNEEVALAEEGLDHHIENPSEGMSGAEFKIVLLKNMA